MYRPAQVQGAAADSSWPAAVAPGGLDAISAAAVLSVGRPVSTWPLARVSEHDCAALVADLVRHGEAGEQGGQAALQRQQTVGPGGTGMTAATPHESHQQNAAAAGQLVGGRTRSATAGSATATSGSRRPGSIYPAIDASPQAVEGRWHPHTQRHGVWLKADAAAAQQLAVGGPDARLRFPVAGDCQPPAAQGLSASPEPGLHGRPLTAVVCQSEVAPCDSGAWPANTHGSYGVTIAADAPPPPATTPCGFGVRPANGEQPPEPPPQPPTECPGNPFAVARDQQEDNLDTFSAVPSVRRRTPTPLLSTLRPDYKAGREHPLLRW